MTIIEIPLAPVTADGLHRPDRRVGLIALAALQTGQAREEQGNEGDCPSGPEPSAEAEAAVASPTAMVDADEVDAVDWRDATIEPPAPSFEPASSDVAHTAPMHAASEASFVPVADSAAPPPIRAGDVYIAHYYARLPGDAARNLYTRLGGPAPHA